MLHCPDDQKVHVLFFLISQSVGGAELHTIALANGLDKTRFRVSVIYLKNEEDGTDVVQGLSKDVLVSCANVRQKIDVSALRKLRHFVERESVDVLVCTNEFALLYGWLTLKFSRSRVALAEVFHTTELRTWKARLQMAFYRRFFYAADLVIFVCEKQRAYWQSKKLSLRFCSVIHNGIDVARFHNDFTSADVLSLRAQFGFASSDFVIGICASLRPEKAHLDLLDALALLKRQGHVLKCMIIGDGPERQKIERAIDARGLRRDTVVTGFLPDVRQYVAACDLMALVSRTIETFSLSALEAMALRKPIVMSEVGGAAEQVSHGHNGQLFPAGDIQALARSILEVKTANADGKMGVNARESVVERFSLDKMLVKYDQTLLALARRNKEWCP